MGSGTHQDCLLLLSLVMASIEETEELVLPETGRTLWNHLALLHLDQLVPVEDCLLMFCGRVDLLSINKRINKVQAYLFVSLFIMWRISGLQQSEDGTETWATWFQRIFVWFVLLVVRYIYKSNARAVKTDLTNAKTITIHLFSESGK